MRKEVHVGGLKAASPGGPRGFNRCAASAACQYKGKDEENCACRHSCLVDATECFFRPEQAMIVWYRTNYLTSMR